MLCHRYNRAEDLVNKISLRCTKQNFTLEKSSPWFGHGGLVDCGVLLPLYRSRTEMERGLSALAAVLVLGSLFIGSVSAASWRGAHPGRLSQECIPNPGSASIGDRASCTFTRSVDVDENRIPARIPFVSCKCPGQLCKDGGDYRCHEVKETFHVMLFNRRIGSIRNETLEMVMSCVCAVSRSTRASSSGVVIRTIDTRGNSTQWNRNSGGIIMV